MAMTKWYRLTKDSLKEMSNRRLHSYYTQMKRDDYYESISDGYDCDIDVTSLRAALTKEYQERNGTQKLRQSQSKTETRTQGRVRAAPRW